MRQPRHGTSSNRQLDSPPTAIPARRLASFTDVLSSETLSEALKQIKVPWNDGIFTPLVTLWVFLEQVLSADHSCRAAVARLTCIGVAGPATMQLV